VAVAVVVVVDGTVGVELGTLVLGPGLVVATDFDELPPPEQPARISAPAATMTGMSSLPLRLRTRIRMSARYRPGVVRTPPPGLPGPTEELQPQLSITSTRPLYLWRIR
jgi:hypothetical protein